jgi:transposase InsO family protein
MMKENDPPRWQMWARFRFSVIGGLLSSPPDAGELQERLQQLAEQTYQHPYRVERMRLGFSTIERWYYLAKDATDPIAALGRKTRSDAGQVWALSAELTAVLEEQYRQYPRWSVQLHCDNLVAIAAKRPELGGVPSYQTVRRRMLDKGWIRRVEPANPTEGHRRAAYRRAAREIRGFEATHVHALWHLDFHQARVKILDQNGRWQTPVALAILDDRSRLCCHLQFYLAETAENLVHGLTQAFLKRGLPRALMTDNGAAMLAEETREGLARFAVEHKTTLPYSAYQNGKQEVFWSQLEGRLLELLRGVDDTLQLSFLNQAAQAWAEQDYHRRVHREIKSTPMERMLAGPRVNRPAPASDELRFAFSRTVTRNQRQSDGTVTVEGIRYELRSRFRLLPRIVLRYPGWDKSRLTLVDAGSGTPLAQILPIDKGQNASGRRRALAAVTEDASPPPAKRDLPELLHQWLVDYAATGLPPAYLPKPEEIGENRHE